ncbi:putative oxidoreductase [Sinomonas cellulolyticus]|uniref:Gfo/Idh/MocA family oxidoreductase n=1 Tax=Sinomonas cellulolyticus TaxID=2801916 RepID=A0ABS1JZ23_9MICC|nr:MULTISPECIES: Gfo/Idh/MocA family oxidoreductase [Sinomonas]MBL0704514.1 Gfo/Idh/MocA family oxidoreductase [Sinomonas cellulolyticus]GHG49119.1 putative oxidoreductase [Sinomonas sp. KCTC 49339]
MTRHIQRPWLSLQRNDDPLEPTGRTVRWGIVATGAIARTVARDLALLPDAALHAVSSRYHERSLAFAREFGAAHAYADQGGTPGYMQLVEDPDVDIVYVATPHGQHHLVAKAALEAGKGVLVEKSFTVNAHEAQELVDLAAAKGLFLMEAVWSRFVPGMLRAFEIIESGEIGEVQWVSADLGFPAPKDPLNRIWAVVAGGGALLDLTVYPLLWAVGALGFPDSLTAVGSLNEEGVDEQNILTLSYSGGQLATLVSSLVAHGSRTATVAGTEGVLTSVGSVNNPTELVVRRGWDPPRAERIEVVGRGYVYELREAVRCIQQGLTESPTMPWRHSLDTMRLFDGVRHQLGIRYPNDQRA